MKQWSTTPVSKGLKTKSFLVAIAVVMVVSGPLQLSHSVSADKYDEKIAQIQRQIDAYNSEAGKLANEAASLENQLAKLANQKAIIQAQIDESQAKYNKLVARIKDNEEKIVINKDVLGDTIADLYVDDAISPLEMLASSQSIGDYIDKQEQRSALRDNLTTRIEEIKKLKKQLEEDRISVERTLKDQQVQREALAAKQAERNKLLSDTRGEEAAYNSLISKGKSEQQQLASQQRAAIAASLAASGISGQAVAGDPNKGGYPSNLYNAPLDALVDPWGMYNRECVSYTAWKVYQKNGYMPYWGGNGHAYQWPGMADANGIPRGSTPRVGSVGVMSAAPYGHVVWVEGVNGDGTINISQFNEGVTGHYSERYNVSPGAFYTYIYF